MSIPGRRGLDPFVDYSSHDGNFPSHRSGVSDGVDMKYSVIYADPPWKFKSWSKKGEGRSAIRHYDVMTLDEIKAVSPVDHAAKDSVLFLWAIDPLLDRAFEVITAWGFTYKTVAFDWAKCSVKGPESNIWPIGGGYWTRANAEKCLLATRGKPKRLNADVRQLIVEPRREHSRKPDRVNGDIERLGAGPYLEMFARHRRPGWDAWGDEVGTFG